MKKILDKIGIVIVFLSLSFGVIAGPGFKCGFNEIVQVGDNIAKVRSICGDPVFKDEVAGPGSEIRKEFWTYRDYADPKWMTTLHFNNGRLTKIESLGRVD